MRRISLAFALPAVMVVGLTALAACGRNGDAEAPSTTVRVTTATTAPVTTATTAPTTTTTRPVVTSAPVGEVFGWLRSFEESADGSITVLVDEAEMLTGTEAIAAARDDGFIGAGEELPNDIYIRNPDESTVELPVSPRALVTLQACYEGGECVTTEEVDVETWSVLLGGEDDPGLDWNWYGAGVLPYEFTVDNGVITAVHESYLP